MQRYYEGTKIKKLIDIRFSGLKILIIKEGRIPKIPPASTAF
jgi:hypothetical protein